MRPPHRPGNVPQPGLRRARRRSHWSSGFELAASKQSVKRDSGGCGIQEFGRRLCSQHTLVKAVRWAAMRGKAMIARGRQGCRPDGGEGSERRTVRHWSRSWSSPNRRVSSVRQRTIVASARRGEIHLRQLAIELSCRGGGNRPQVAKPFPDSGWSNFYADTRQHNHCGGVYLNDFPCALRTGHRYGSEAPSDCRPESY